MKKIIIFLNLTIAIFCSFLECDASQWNCTKTVEEGYSCLNYGNTYCQSYPIEESDQSIFNDLV